MDDVETRFLTPTEVRTLLGISRTTCHDWTAKGYLRAYTTPSGRRKYPAHQPTIVAELAALGRTVDDALRALSAPLAAS